MGKKADLDELRLQFIGKTFSFLTVIDVFFDESHKIMFRCKCKCGNITSKTKQCVISGHSKSCGCYRKSDEFKNKLSQSISDWAKNHPEELAEKGRKHSQWHKDNPDKVAKKIEKQKQWAKENPDKIKEQAAHYSQWCKDNPDKVKERSEKVSQYYKDNPEACKNIGNKISEWCANNPDKLKEKGEKYSQWCKEHPEEVKLRGEKYSQWCKEHPENLAEQGKRYSDKCREDPSIGLKISEALKKLYAEHPEKAVELSNNLKKWREENPDKVAEANEKHKQWFINNKDKLELQKERHRQWFKDNPDKVKERSDKFRAWCKENPDKVKEIGIKKSIWSKNNPDKLKDQGERYSKWVISNPDKHLKQIENYKYYRKSLRKDSKIYKLFSLVHSDDVVKLKSGDLLCSDKIRILCPNCGEYGLHSVSSIFSFSKNEIIKDIMPLCDNCCYSSSYEIELRDFISEFYCGEHVYNNRDMIYPFELDLYYPKKKIAIEFNGDYWHDENHKSNDYHYNKFKLCYENGITLVSIFEKHWCNNKEAIKSYIKDLFFSKENKLSLDVVGYMNNNYPMPACKIPNLDLEDFYITDTNKKVFTCGYTKL